MSIGGRSCGQRPFPNDRQDLRSSRPRADRRRRGEEVPLRHVHWRPGAVRLALRSLPAGLLAASLLIVCALPASAQDETGRRVDELVAAMTLEEKLGQLTLVSQGPPLRWDDIPEGRAGAFLNFNNAPDILRA